MTVAITDYLGQAKAKFAEAKALLTDPNTTAEDHEKIDGLVAEAKGLQVKAEQLSEISRITATMDAPPPATKINSMKSKPPVGSAFDYFEDYLEALFEAKASGWQHVDKRLIQFKDKATATERKDMVESVGASGGFLVPTEFYGQLQALAPEVGLVRGRATVIRMRRRSVDIPAVDQTGTTAGIGHWFGGMVFYWTEEATAKTETNAEFKKVTLVAHKLTGYTEASDELLEDSAISLSDFFNSQFGFVGGITWMEDFAFMRGTGAGQPLGVVNAGATITVARASVGTPIQFVDTVNMLENFLPSGRGVWFANQTTLSNLMQMQDPSATYIWQPNLQAGVPPSLWGNPIVFTEKLPTVGNAGDLLLADWRYYLIGDRQATTVESSKDYRFQYDLTAWRAVHRVDGQPWLSAPLTLQDGTAQVSPFVILGAKTT